MAQFRSAEGIGADSPHESDGSAIHPCLSGSKGAAAPWRESARAIRVRQKFLTGRLGSRSWGGERGRLLEDAEGAEVAVFEGEDFAADGEV